jgi:hypothetical protein
MTRGKMTLEEIDHDLRMFDEDRETPEPEVEIGEIAAKLREVLKTKVYIQPAREYVYSEDAVVYLDEQGRSIPKPVSGQTTFTAWIRISFLAGYAAVVWRKTEDGQDWTVVYERDLPEPLSAVNAKVHSLLDEYGFKIVPDTLLYQYLAGRVSQLDGSTASVKSALFSEID